MTYNSVQSQYILQPNGWSPSNKMTKGPATAKRHLE